MDSKEKQGERGRGPKKRNYIKTELKTKQNELNPNPEPREPESISESKSERTVSGSNGMTWRRAEKSKNNGQLHLQLVGIANKQLQVANTLYYVGWGGGLMPWKDKEMERKCLRAVLMQLLSIDDPVCSIVCELIVVNSVGKVIKH